MDKFLLFCTWFALSLAQNRKTTTMEKQVKKLARVLKIEYGVFILLPVLLSIFYELDWLPAGYYADDGRMQYILGTTGILLALALVPLSLKLFNFGPVKRIKEMPLERAIRRYKACCSLRTGMLEAVVLTNIAFYYLTLQNTGLLCAFIGIVASFFCIPGENRIRQELDFD